MAKVRNRKRQSQGVAEQTSVHEISIGERLRQAREKRGLDVPTVAEQLHLKQSMVLALEGEDFSRLPARVFVRGYYRNYARLLELPEQQLLREFDARCPEGEECEAAPPVVAQGVRKEISSNHGLVKLVTWLVVISVLAAFGLWWKDYSERQATQPAETPPPLEVEADAGDGGAVTAAAESAAPAVEAPPVAAVSGEPVAQQQEAGTGVSASAEVPEKTSAPPPATEPEPPVPAAKKVRLRFSEDSWVDIRGAHRSFKLVGTRKAGDSIDLGGEPPYNIIIGNARGVTLLVDGKPHDFSSKIRRNVARFTLDP